MTIGFTTSFPVEVLFAAGHKPVDLNNIFIEANPIQTVKDAEYEGLPRNICSWIKGLYGIAIAEQIKAVVGVVQGDCSNMLSLMSLFKDKDIEVIPFSFPYNKDRHKLETEIRALAERFNVTSAQIYETKKELDEIRKLLIELDCLTYQENKVSGKENHYWLVCSSDFWGEPLRFKKELLDFLKEAKERKPIEKPIRLAFLGVPSIFTDFYDFFNNLDADIFFNEVQRQFSMPFFDDIDGNADANSQSDPKLNPIVNQYLAFTYPYSVFDRIADISPQIKKRNIHGLISYTQAFCHRQIDNLILKKYLPYPFIAIEGDTPNIVDERTKLRLESFLDMLRFSRV